MYNLNWIPIRLIYKIRFWKKLSFRLWSIRLIHLINRADLIFQSIFIILAFLYLIDFPEVDLPPLGDEDTNSKTTDNNKKEEINNDKLTNENKDEESKTEMW